MIELIGGIDAFWSLAKLAVLFAILLYLVFAYVVVKQVQLMNDTLEVGFEKITRNIAYAHLFVALFVFILAVIIL